jgi:hypothetical protein
LLGLAWTAVFLFNASIPSWDDRHITIHRIFSVELGCCELFFACLAETMILPISASHETWDDPQIFKTNYRFPLKERFTDVLTQQIMIRDFTLRIKSGNICYQ